MSGWSFRCSEFTCNQTIAFHHNCSSRAGADRGAENQTPFAVLTILDNSFVLPPRVGAAPVLSNLMLHTQVYIPDIGFSKSKLKF
jgi:hypothetical protein